MLHRNGRMCSRKYNHRDSFDGIDGPYAPLHSNNMCGSQNARITVKIYSAVMYESNKVSFVNEDNLAMVYKVPIQSFGLFLAVVNFWNCGQIQEGHSIII